MFEQILSAPVPAIITIMLGYFAAWHHDFSLDEVPTLNRMVMNYALPLALFVGIFSAGREELMSDLPLVGFLLLAIVGTYVLVLLIAVYVFRHPPGLSALRALMAAGPSTAFVGVPVLGTLYGTTANIPIAAGSIIVTLFLLPVTLILLGLHSAQNSGAGAGKQADNPAAEPVSIPGAISRSLKLPVVWLPTAGFAMVLLGIGSAERRRSVPVAAGPFIGRRRFVRLRDRSCGYKIVLSVPVYSLVFIKNIVQPAVVCAGMLALGYKDPILGQTVVTTALPAVALVVMLAVQYRTAIPEAASALLISTFGSLLTISLFIWLVG